MNERIKELALQAGLVRVGDFGMKRWEGPRSDSINDQDLEKFAALVEAAARADEREECAKVCDDLPPPEGYNIVEISFWDITSLACGDAIRARGTT